ncbi:MAG: hypothetical protein ACRDVL_01275 [Acidimicrobiia bacterium]
MAIGLVPIMFSYFSYAAAFVPDEGSLEPSIDLGLLAIALVLAPISFVVVGFVSKNPQTPRLVLWSMGLLVVIGLTLGWLAPVLGAAGGFGAGVALTLNMPEFPRQLRRRLLGVSFAIAYMFLLLVVATPAGVLTGALLPPLMVGFADEYGAWQTRRGTAA